MGADDRTGRASGPRFCKELTKRVRSVEDGPLDADGIDESEGFFAKLTAPYEPPSPSRDPKIDWTKHSPSPKLNRSTYCNEAPVTVVDVSCCGHQARSQEQACHSL